MLEAVSVVERWVDGQESVSELDTARPFFWFSPPGNVWSATKEAAWGDAFAAGVWAGFDQAGFIAAMVEQCDLLRDIIGNPFRPIAVEPGWLSWNDGTIPKLAQAIYEERMFDCLPILADALEEVGCSDPDLLGHLRGPGPHVRGCWVVDLILGRE
jgi:hypothetical protein